MRKVLGVLTEDFRLYHDLVAEPGVAVVGDGHVLDARVADSPEAVAQIVERALRTFPSSRQRIRVGHGDRTNRNRILNGLAREGFPAEIVDEAGTTHPTERPDIDAAIRIAFVAGGRGAPPPERRRAPGAR